MSEHSSTAENTGLQNLLSMGFTEIEAMRLIFMKEHVTEQIEYREMIEESRRLNFIRWLIEHNRLSR